MVRLSPVKRPIDRKVLVETQKTLATHRLRESEPSLPCDRTDQVKFFQGLLTLIATTRERRSHLKAGLKPWIRFIHRNSLPAATKARNNRVETRIRGRPTPRLVYRGCTRTASKKSFRWKGLSRSIRLRWSMRRTSTSKMRLRCSQEILCLGSPNLILALVFKSLALRLMNLT